MKEEIERKFLVLNDGFLAGAVECRHLVQGYICRESGRTVRVRIDEPKGIAAGESTGNIVIGESNGNLAACRDAGEARGFLTIKGRSTADGTSRSEWEYDIPVEEARGLLGLCTGRIIDKDRYIVPADGGTGGGDGDLKWEVDVFHGAHEGLVLAEIELDDASRPFVRPAWLGMEVTGDRRYYNSVLSAD